MQSLYCYYQFSPPIPSPIKQQIILIKEKKVKKNLKDSEKSLITSTVAWKAVDPLRNIHGQLPKNISDAERKVCLISMNRRAI